MILLINWGTFDLRRCRPKKSGINNLKNEHEIFYQTYQLKHLVGILQKIYKNGYKEGI